MAQKIDELRLYEVMLTLMSQIVSGNQPANFIRKVRYKKVSQDDRQQALSTARRDRNDQLP